MARFNVDFNEGNNELFEAEMEPEEELDVDFGDVQQVVTTNYKLLRNKPSINDVELVGNKTTEDLKIVFSATRTQWDLQPTLQSQKNAVYIYTDYQTRDNGDGTYTFIPGIKIGDGMSYLIDMPFVAGNDEVIEQHILNNTIHVTEEDKESWNNKWRGYVDEANPTVLVFTTN